MRRSEGEYVDCLPYSNGYEAMKDVPICTAVTAVDLPSGSYGREAIVLVFHQSLWFDDELENYLINPNQEVRSYECSIGSRLNT